MFVSLSMALSLPLVLSMSAGASFPRTPDPLLARPMIPASLVPAMPGIALGPEPRLVGIRQGARSLFLDGFVDDAIPSADQYFVYLTGLVPNADQVVVYLDGERVAAGLAQAVEWSLPCSLTRRGGLLCVWVFRAGEGPIPLPPISLPK